MNLVELYIARSTLNKVFDFLVESVEARKADGFRGYLFPVNPVFQSECDGLERVHFPCLD